MDLKTWILLYIAIVLVIFFHESGHRPRRIKFYNFGLKAAAMESPNRFGGLIFNVVIFTSIYMLKPEQIVLQLMGLVAWIHFIVYMILGSFNYEPKDSQVNIKTYIFDDVPNKTWPINLLLAGLALYLFYGYYSSIILAVVS